MIRWLSFVIAFVIGVITVIGVIDSKKIEIASVIALIIVIGVIGAKKNLRPLWSRDWAEIF